MEIGKQQVCPCGLTKELCAQKHITLDRDLSQFRGDLHKLREDCDNHIKDSELRLDKSMDICETHMLERMGFQAEITSEITSSIRMSYKEGLTKLTDGLNLHRKDIDTLLTELPTKAIDRMVSLEKWKWLLAGVGIAIAGMQIMMWRFYNHLSSELEDDLEMVRTLLEQLGG